MKSYSLRARPKIQQCLKRVLAASEPNSTYDAVIIGGGMNAHFAAGDYIFYELSCVALLIEVCRKMLNVHRHGVVNVKDSLRSRICGRADFAYIFSTMNALSSWVGVALLISLLGKDQGLVCNLRVGVGLVLCTGAAMQPLSSWTSYCGNKFPPLQNIQRRHCCLYICILQGYIIIFIFIPWIRTGLQNPCGYGNSQIVIIVYFWKIV